MKYFKYSLPTFGVLVFFAVLAAAPPAEKDSAHHHREAQGSARGVLKEIEENSLRGHVSFLASDLLEGRDTPSRGLDIAAEYVAAQFRRAGLEAPVDGSYFQTADMLWRSQTGENFSLTLRLGEESVSVSGATASLPVVALRLQDAPVWKADFQDRSGLSGLKTEDVQGKIVMTLIPDFTKLNPSEQGRLFGRYHRFRDRMALLGAALVVTVDQHGAVVANSPGATLTGEGKTIEDPKTPRLLVHDAALERLYGKLPEGLTSATITVEIPEPKDRTVTLRNVIGLLRGSDPALSDTYLIVSAHYDHTGRKAFGEGDLIYNGANDNASGTAAMIEMAEAFARSGQRPRRSIVFLAYYGEEKGLLGARHYAANPVFPLDKTVANLNLEQLGRTDSTCGPVLRKLSLTGSKFSDVGKVLEKAGRLTDVEIYEFAHGDDFFDRSDNQALANVGVPAHTVVAAYEFPDYHGLGDQWEKLDYANMAAVTRTITMAAWLIAENEQEPMWTSGNKKAQPYREAWEKRRQPAPAAVPAGAN
jgi:hypothetical protein